MANISFEVIYSRITAGYALGDIRTFSLTTRVPPPKTDSIVATIRVTGAPEPTRVGLENIQQTEMEIIADSVELDRVWTQAEIDAGAWEGIDGDVSKAPFLSQPTIRTADRKFIDGNCDSQVSRRLWNFHVLDLRQAEQDDLLATRLTNLTWVEFKAVTFNKQTNANLTDGDLT